MTATLTLDEAGRLVLPEAAMRTLGMKPGAAVKVEVTPRRIELLDEGLDDLPLITELTPDGLLKIPEGIGQISDEDIVAAIKADREERIRRVSRR